MAMKWSSARYFENADMPPAASMISFRTRDEDPEEQFTPSALAARAFRACIVPKNTCLN